MKQISRIPNRPKQLIKTTSLPLPRETPSSCRCMRFKIQHSYDTKNCNNDTLLLFLKLLLVNLITYTDPPLPIMLVIITEHVYISN